MPGLNGTGPRGQGAMTGRGLGRCSGIYPLEGLRLAKNNGYGLGLRRGRGFGYKRGLANRWGIRPPVYASVPFLEPEEQLDTLKQEMEYLDSEIDNIKKTKDIISKKIKELEKNNKTG